MKKILITVLLLFSINSFAQTSGFEFKFNGNTAKYDKETNTGTFSGKTAGSFEINSYMAISSVDTSLWQYVQNNDNAKYSFVTNRGTYGGLTAGKIKIPVIDLIGASGSTTDTSLIPFLNQNNTFTGAINTFTGKVVVGTGTSNGTADFLVMGDTITFRGTVYRDSSYWREEINPFSQRLKISAIGKTGNNMLTIDSTLITSALAMTIIGDFTTGGNIFAGSNSKYIGWSTRSVLQSTADGTVDFFFNNGTTRATIDAGILRGRTTTPIATATTTGVAGTIIVGSDNYIYICTATNTWVRVLGLTW